MKILFVGLGSAGQRHIRNIIKTSNEEVEILSYRVRKLSRLFDDNLSLVEGKNVVDEYKIRVFDDLSLALDEKPDVAFITNPNSMHISTALQIAERGIDIFMEKPVSDSLDGINELLQIIKCKKLIFYVGFQMRLHPCVMKLKMDIDAKIIGDIVAVDCQMGESLNKMHKYEDYRDMIESKKDKGGGVILCQIHELDYLYWIFGMPNEVYSIGGKYSDLEIDVEDAATTICKFTKENYVFPITIHQNFLQNPPVRTCSIIGVEGTIKIDLLQNHYSLSKDGIKQEVKFDKFNRNDMYIEEINIFFNYVRNRKQDSLTLKDGIGSLELGLAIKKSIDTGKLIVIQEKNYE